MIPHGIHAALARERMSTFLAQADHHDHGALGALDHARGGGVGIARYVRDRDEPAVTDRGTRRGTDSVNTATSPG